MKNDPAKSLECQLGVDFTFLDMKFRGAIELVKDGTMPSFPVPGEVIPAAKSNRSRKADTRILRIRSRAMQPISLSALAQKQLGLARVELPLGLPDVTIDDVTIGIAPRTGRFVFYGESGLRSSIGKGKHRLVTRLALLLEKTSARGAVTGALRGSLTYCGIEFGVQAVISDKKASLGATAKDLCLSEIVEKLLGLELPAEIPKLNLETLDLTIDSRQRISIHGKLSAVQKHALNLGASSLPLKSLEFEFSRDRGGITCAIRIEGGECALARDMQFTESHFFFTCNGKGKKRWQLGGDVRCRLFGRDFALQAKYAASAGNKLFKLTCTDTATLVSIPAIAALEVNGFSLGVASEKGSAASWELMARGGIDIFDVLRSKGTLHMDYRDGHYRFAFTPKNSKISLPILFDPSTREPVAKLDITFGDLWIEFADRRFAFESSVALECAALHLALPAAIDRFIPRKIEAGFTATEKGVVLTVSEIIDAPDIPLPPVAFAEHVEVRLGVMCLDASDLRLEIGSDRVALSMELGIGLPSELNHNLGVDRATGEPLWDFFRTYVPGDRDATTINAQLRVGTDGLGFALLDSPFGFIDFEEPDHDGKVWCELDFRECGAVRFQLPDFRLDLGTGSFVASGGFEVTRDLALPVSLLKRTLDAMQLDLVADLLPETLPLMDISILDDNNRFQAHQLVELIEGILGIAMPRELEQAIDIFAELTNDLPDDLRNYFRFQIPKGFVFDISVTPDGGVKLKAAVTDKDYPIRILLPTLGPMYIPQLVGIEFRSIAFGEVLSGALLLLELDVRVDQFDLVAIGAAMLTKNIPAVPLAPPQKLQQRLIVDELFMLIVYEAAVPIPIPVFFTELGIEYRGLEDAIFQAHLGFPMPRLNLAGIGKALAELVSFVRDPDALLSEDALGEMDIRLVIGANFLELPGYLGGAVIGTREGVGPLGLYGMMANILNTLKQFSLVKLIGAIPIEYRVGNERIELGPLGAEAAWLLTTPTEFIEGEFERLVATPQQAQDFMKVLPHMVSGHPRRPPAKTMALPVANSGQGGAIDADGVDADDDEVAREEEGMVLFMRGEWEIDRVLTTEAIVGLATSSSLGFHTGFKIGGELLELLDLEIAGRVAINKDKVLDAELAGGLLRPASGGVAFSGAGEYVALPAMEADFSNGMTVEVWVRCLDIVGDARLIDFASAVSGDNIVLAIDAAGHGIRFGIGDGGDLRGFGKSGILTREAWTHVAVSVDKSGRTRLYQNGDALDIGDVVLPLPAAVARDQNFIGRAGEDRQGLFNGELTGLRIWNRALKAETIRARMTRRMNGNETELICCWPFAAGGDGARDGTGHEVILRNQLRLCGPEFRRRGSGRGFESTGLVFDGESSYLELGEPFPGGTDFTVAMWVNPETIDDGQLHGLAGSCAADGEQFAPGLWLAADSGGLRYDASDADGNRFGGTLENFFVEAGEWTHVSWVKKGSEFHFYRNGARFSSAPAPEAIDAGTAPYHIGRAGSYWSGIIDDVQIWGRALGPRMIRSQMRKPLTGYEPGLVSYLPFEEGFGSRTLDLARREKIRIHAARWRIAEPLPLGGLVFDGSDASLDIPAAAIPAGDEITVSLWVGGGAAAAGSNPVIEARDAGGIRVLKVGLPGSDGSVTFDCGNNGADCDRIAKPAGAQENEGDWIHWVFTKNTAIGEMAIYRNGLLWHRNAADEPKLFALPESRAVTIGAEIAGTGRYRGRMAQVSLWDKALEAEQIAGLLQHSLGGTEAGLVAYWPLLEGRGDTAFDLVGDNHAGVVNACWHEPSRFELQGLRFDGRDDFVDVGSGIGLGGRFTIEAWVKGRRGILLQRDGDRQNEGHLQLGFNSELRFVDDAGRLHRLEYGGLPDGEWAHLAAVYDGEEMRIHVNGTRVAAMAVDAGLAASSAKSLIGKSRDAAVRDHFDGVLDEVRIWSYGRSPQGIKRKMFQRMQGSEAGLVAYWPFLAGKGLRAFDFAGGNNGLLHGAQWYAASDLQLVGRYFDGTDYIEVPDPFSADGDFTVSLWVNPDRIDDGRYHGMLGKDEKSGGNWYRKPGLWLSPNNGGLMYDSYSRAKTRFGGELENFFTASGQWLHIAWVKRGKSYLFYRNGYLFAERRAPEKLFVRDSGYYIGKVDTGWAGLLDEVRIWGHAREAAEIEADMRRRLSDDVPGLRGYWSFGDKGEQFSQTLDAKRGATSLGADTRQARAFAPGGLRFDGHFDYLDLGRRLPLAGEFTIEAWINGSGSGTIFQKGAGSTAIGHLQLDYNGLFRYVDDGGRTQALRYRGLPEREWAHLAATCDGSEMKVFVNGEEIACGAVDGGVGQSSAPSFFGNRLTLAETGGFRGRIDEIRIWDHARDADELQAQMHSRLSGTESGLVSRLSCNDGIGLTAFDDAGRNNGRLHGPTWANSAMIEMEGLAFDGKDDYLSCGAIMDPLGGPWSVELWFRWNGGAGEQVLYSKDRLFKAAVRDGFFQYLWSPADEWRGGEIVAVAPGEWIHAAVVYDGAEQAIYIDGERVFEHPQQGAMGASAGPFLVGAEDSSTPAGFFGGDIHSLRIWDKALTDVEVLTRRYDDLTGIEPNLVGCWKLQPGADDALGNRAARNRARWHGKAVQDTALAPAATSVDLSRIEDYFSLERSNSSFVIAGHCHLRLLGKEVILGDILVQNKLFAFRGELDLFTEASPLQVKGGLRGVISGDRFALHGDMDVRLFTVTLVGGNVLLCNQGFFLKGILLDQSVSLILRKTDDERIEFHGGLDRAVVFGKAFRLCDPLDPGKGPGLTISGPHPALLTMRGQVELLGIRQSVVIAARDDRFIAELDARLWDLFECRLTLIGRDLNRLGEFDFEVVFVNGLDQLVRALAEEIDRILDWASAELAKAREAVDNAGEVVAKGFEAEKQRLHAEAARRKRLFLEARGKLDEQADAVGREIDRLLGEIRRIEGQIEAESAKFSAQIDKARGDLDKAQAAVNSILGEIHRTEKWYNGLPAADWPWKPNRAKEWVWVGPKIAALYTAYGTSTATLQSAKLYLAGINELQKTGVGGLRLSLETACAAKRAADLSRARVQQDLDVLIRGTPDWVLNPELIVVEITDAVARDVLGLARDFLVAAEGAVDGIENACHAVQRALDSPVKIKSAGFGGKLGTAVGTVFEVMLEVEYFDLSSSQSVSRELCLDIDFRNIPGAAISLIGHLFEPLAAQQQKLIVARAKYESAVNKTIKPADQ